MIKPLAKRAFTFENLEISYYELIRQINNFAAMIEISPGQRIAIMAENRPEWIYALFCIWKQGGIAVPIDSNLSGSELQTILDNCQPSHIFCSNQCLETLDCVASELINLDNCRPADFNDLTADWNPPDEALALIVYTSGTTGGAKGVTLSFGNIRANIDSLTALEMFTPQDVISGLLPFHHILPLTGTVIAPFIIGASVVYTNQLNGPAIMQTMQKNRVTLFLGVPRLYELFHKGILDKLTSSVSGNLLLTLARRLNSQKAGRWLFSFIHQAFGGQVRAWLSGGAKLDEGIARDLWCLGFKLVEGYGMTETSPLIAFNGFDNVCLGSVGRPMTEVKILDGEILVRGPNVMQGYWRNEPATRSIIQDNWLHTGDMGHFDANGYLFVSGRKDEMLTLKSGKNINPEEIERTLLQQSRFISDIAVTIIEGRLAAIIFPNFNALAGAGISNITEAIRWQDIDRYNTSAQPHKRIQDLRIIRHELPRTKLGKLRRFQLEGIQAENDNSFKPRNQQEELLLGILRQFSIRPIAYDSHLEIDLGLDSLDRIQLQLELENRLGISELDLAIHNTPAALLGAIDRIPAGRPNQERQLFGRTCLRQQENNLILQIMRPVVRHYFRLKINGLQNLPEQPFILVSNHQSYLDALLLAAIIPSRILKRTYFFAKDKSLYRSRLGNYLMRHSNVVVFDLDNGLRHSLEQAASLIRSGHNMVIFPEGVRTRDGQMAPFKRLFSLLSSELNVPIVPVAIQGAYQALPRGRHIPKPGEIRMTIMTPQRADTQDHHSFTRSIQKLIASQVETPRSAC